MPRIRPCEHCKLKRRKCELALGAKTCARCSRLKLDCILDTRPIANNRYTTASFRDSTMVNDVTFKVDLDNEFEDLCQNVETLKEEMKQLQLNLDQQKQQNATLARPHSPTMATNSRMDTLLCPKGWNLTFVNGQLRLETGIKSLSDLLRYRQIQLEHAKSIRYLSPFSNTSIRFEMKDSPIICKLTYVLAQQGHLIKSQGTPTNSYTYSPWRHRHQYHTNQLRISSALDDFTLLDPSYINTIPSSTCCETTLLNTAIDKTSPRSSSHCPEQLIDLFVQQYFQCYNQIIPIVHQPTFMAHYSKHPSSDPVLEKYTTLEQRNSTSSPASSFPFTTTDFISQHDHITLAICCFMSMSYCKHLTFTSHQKREYGEYYYATCREQIDELYDDPSPHRQLDALISINLLYKFTTVTLRLSETRKLASIGLILSAELWKYADQPDSLFTEVEKEMVLRNAVVASITFYTAEFICAKRIDDLPPRNICFKSLPGESEMTVSMLELHTFIFELIFHYDCQIMIKERRHAVIGQVGHATLEAMIRFEQKCLDWWKSLPKKWRYCEDPFDLSAKSAIDSCEYEQAMVAHSFLLVFTLGVHTALVYSQNSHDHVADMVQKRAVAMTLNCSELLVVLILRMKVATQYCGYTCDYFLYVFDALLCLFNHAQKIGDNRMMPMIAKHTSWLMNDLNDMVQADNQPPCASSIFSSTPSASGQAFSCNGFGHDINPSVYTNYPLPGQAILFDMMNSTAKNIGGIPY